MVTALAWSLGISRIAVAICARRSRRAMTIKADRHGDRNENLTRCSSTATKHSASAVVGARCPRGQPRNCTLICAHRIPLVSPFGHYRSQKWHRIVLRVNRRNGIHPVWPSLLESKRRQLPRGHTEDQTMPSSKPPTWRSDIDALAFQPGDHIGLCMVHRRAFRTLLQATPSPRECMEFFNAHRAAFQAAACAKLLRTNAPTTMNFHLTSRDVTRQLKK